MTFPQFANSVQMQIILAGLSLISSGIYNWTAFHFAQAFYAKDIEFEKKSKHIIVVSSLVYVGTIYGVFILQNFNCFDKQTELELIIPNPLLCIMVYIVMITMCNLHRGKLINILRHSYLYSLCISTLSLLTTRLFVKQDESYSFFSNAVVVILFIPICMIIYKVGMHFVKRHNFKINIPNSMPEYEKSNILWTFVVLLSAYAMIIFVLSDINDSIPEHLAVCACLALMLLCDMIVTYNTALKYEIENKNIYITGLMHTADNYLQFKTEFQSILKGYDNHIQKEDFAALAQYHQNLIEPTKLRVQEVNVAQKMPQNPPFVSVVLSKMEYANQMNVNFFIGDICSLEKMHMEEFDLSRMLSNLLNNAIEAAALSDKRTVKLSVTEKNPRCKVIKLYNSTASDVDLDTITDYGVSTKGNHMGVGLTQVKNIVGKYPNCLINFEYSKNVFEVKIELSYPVIS